MSVKKSPIEEHKEKDIILCREELIKLIEAEALNATAQKVKVEAIKSLGRFHHALQVEKVTAKAGVTSGVVVQQLPPEVQARLDTEIEEILGRNTTRENTPALS